jgi:hypothetical protein
MTGADWKCIETDGMPTKPGHNCYAVWNGSYWVNASLLWNNRAFVFYDYCDIPIKKATHYAYIGNGPDNWNN